MVMSLHLESILGKSSPSKDPEARSRSSPQLSSQSSPQSRHAIFVEEQHATIGGEGPCLGKPKEGHPLDHKEGKLPVEPPDELPFEPPVETNWPSLPLLHLESTPEENHLRKAT